MAVIKKEYVGDAGLTYLMGLIDSELSNYSTTEEVAKAIADARTGQFKKVESLPATGEVGYIYLVASSASSDNNSYDEYYWDADASKFEFLGTTAVDLSDYLTDDDVTPMSNEKIKSLWDSVFTPVEGA